jgi:hypothetical protein
MAARNSTILFLHWTREGLVCYPIVSLYLEQAVPLTHVFEQRILSGFRRRVFSHESQRPEGWDLEVGVCIWRIPLVWVCRSFHKRHDLERLALQHAAGPSLVMLCDFE